MPALPTVAGASSSWPTPDASVSNDGEELTTFEDRRLQEKHRNGNGVGTPLAMKVKAWPTPTASETKQGDDFLGGNPTLCGMVKRWPTPTASENEQRTTHHPPSATDGRGRGKTLAGEALGRWPTPTSMDSVSSGAAAYSTASGRHPGVTLTDAACRGLLVPTTEPGGTPTSSGGRVLNPRFVEALMGWPPGWTDCASWETESSQIRPSSRSPCSGSGS